MFLLLLDAFIFLHNILSSLTTFVSVLDWVYFTLNYSSCHAMRTRTTKQIHTQHSIQRIIFSLAFIVFLVSLVCAFFFHSLSSKMLHYANLIQLWIQSILTRRTNVIHPSILIEHLHNSLTLINRSNCIVHYWAFERCGKSHFAARKFRLVRFQCLPFPSGGRVSIECQANRWICDISWIIA